MPNSNTKNKYLYDGLKRILDVCLTSALLIFFSPIIITVSLAIMLDSPGPILADTPERVGKDGKKFKMFKFRSMIQNAHKMLREDPKYLHLYNRYKKGSYKLRDDPRITPVGHFIRKHSLDEIPQFLNVLRGEMSLVGPRAYYPDELEEQQGKYPHTRKLVKIVISVKTGITGLWQGSGRSDINFDKRIELDAQYVLKRSVMRDLLIILRSPWVMITGKGAL